MKKLRHLNDKTFQEFQPDLSSLSQNELTVLGQLVEVSKMLAKLYDDRHPNGQPQFYPEGATRSEIEKAAAQNPQILAPYTVVERDDNGKLIAIPYHIKNQTLLEPISEKLIKIAQLTQDPGLSKYLVVAAKGLLSGDYDQILTSWIKLKSSRIDFVIGPTERIEDEMFFCKRSYLAWVGVINTDLTSRASNFKEAVISNRKKLVIPEEQVNLIDKAQVYVNDTAAFAGLISKFAYTGMTLPNDFSLLENYGSRATLFLPVARENFTKRQLQIFQTIFATNFQKSFSREDLLRGYLYLIMMHEISRMLIRYRFATTRLKELYPVFNELALETSAVKNCGILLLKDMISQKEMEAVLVMLLTRVFDYYFEQKDHPGSEAYVLGNAIILNFLISSGALQMTKEGISWPNFTKMFIAVSNCAEEIEKILSEGSYDEAKRYLSKNSSTEIFKQFSSLSSI